MPTLHIKLFGDFRLTYGQVVLTEVNQRRLQSLLAYLLLHRTVSHSRQHLAFLFWPDTKEAQARTNLRRELHNLRRILPEVDQFLSIDTTTIGWRSDAPFTLDVADFESLLVQAKEGMQAARQAALEKAVTLYSGQLLPGCYEEWLLSERERLEQLFIDALEQLLFFFEDQGNYPEAIRYGQRLLRFDPLHERTYSRLMDLYALIGDRARALRMYQTCVTVLERELEVEPGQKIQEAYHHLMHLEKPPALENSPVRALRKSVRLVGREKEWEMLRTVWSQALQGKMGLVLISGEAGIGKTHLAETMLAAISQEGIITATGRAYAAEGRLAYGPVVEWLRSDNLYSALSQLDQIWLSELARLLPELLSERPDLSPPEALTERWQRQRLFETLARAILSDKRPRLLLLDDLQWSDQETLEWVRYLLHVETSTPLLIVGTVRSEAVDADHPLQALQAALQRSGQLTEIRLEPLSAEQTSALATQTAGHALAPDQALRLYQETEGSPLFIVEMVRAQLSEGDGGSETTLPPKVQGVIQSRLGQLSAGARDLAALTATLGRSFAFEVLVEASTEDEDSVVQYLDELWQRRIIREQGVSAYDFSHDRIREVVYQSISPVKRRLLHRRAAEALEQVYAANPDPVSVQLAAHYEQAGWFEQAVVWYERAAGVARQLLATREAITLGRAGLALLNSLATTPDRMSQELSMLLALEEDLRIVHGFSVPEFEEILRRAEMLSLKLGDRRQQFAVLAGLKRYYSACGDMRESRQIADELLSLARQLDDPDIQRSAYNSKGTACLQLGHFKQAREFSEGAGNDHLLALTLWLLGYPAQARKKIDEALSISTEPSSPFQASIIAFFAAWLYWCLDARELMVATGEQMVSLGRKYEIAVSSLSGAVVSGWALAEQGELEAGIAQMRQGIDGFKTIGHAMYQTHRFGRLIEIYLKVGQIEAGLAAVDEAFDLSERFEQRTWDAELHRLKGELLLAQGAPEEKVEACYRQAIDIAQQQSAKSLELRAAISLSRLWQRQGKRAEAHRLLSEIYNWFSEGFDTRDLKEAEALLQELSSV